MDEHHPVDDWPMIVAKCVLDELDSRTPGFRAAVAQRVRDLADARAVSSDPHQAGQAASTRELADRLQDGG